jgi:hypothetical protein
METPCAIALILAGSLGILTRKNWGMPLLVLACFTRYECVLLCALAGIWVSVRRQWTKSSLLGCIGIGLLGVAWLWWEYGTIIPNTVVAKSHLYVTTYQHVVRAFISSKSPGGFVPCAGCALVVLWQGSPSARIPPPFCWPASELFSGRGLHRPQDIHFFLVPAAGFGTYFHRDFALDEP